MSNDIFALQPVMRRIWEEKYRWRTGAVIHDSAITDTWHRVAGALAQVEQEPSRWAREFYGVLETFRFLPAGRILAGAGTDVPVTLFNCFVMGEIEDTIDGIFNALREGAITMQKGGGVGYDFSTLRPGGTLASSSATVASGPVSFMRVWDAMCATMLSTGSRRGAMMATLRCDHPDILEFVRAKNRPGELTHFNLSVLVSDAFMKAVERDEDWNLAFRSSQGPQSTLAELERVMPAREIWQAIVKSAYETAEPGVIFVDRINQMNNLYYCETISATNPCGEVPLPPYGACDLGSINLTRFVDDPFTSHASLNYDAIRGVVRVAVRMMDNVIDVSEYPLEQQRHMQINRRRIGLGITGLADMLIMQNIRYDSEAARVAAADVMATVCHEAYRTSIDLAREKGAFPAFSKDQYLAGAFIKTLPDDIRAGVEKYGIRNSHVTAIAPAGTISLLAGNVSSGLEPVFSHRYSRRILVDGQNYEELELWDYACRLWQLQERKEDLPPAFVAARQIAPFDHLTMQAALQPYVDNAISKTINLPENYPIEKFEEIYMQAWRNGLKGCTTYRQNCQRGTVLSEYVTTSASLCCDLEREFD